MTKKRFQGQNSGHYLFYRSSFQILFHVLCDYSPFPFYIAIFLYLFVCATVRITLSNTMSIKMKRNELQQRGVWYTKVLDKLIFQEIVLCLIFSFFEMMGALPLQLHIILRRKIFLFILKLNNIFIAAKEGMLRGS